MKNLGFSLVAVSLFLLAACGASEGPETTGGGEAPTAKKAPETAGNAATAANLAPAAADGAKIVLDVSGMT
jgi:hypothetical protein